ncbi:hypothetical protein DIPPA_28114 [Diplonema papillatum]|nr:hypothetical protein DIPPA_28114 [Diplonema papillatum]
MSDAILRAMFLDVNRRPQSECVVQAANPNTRWRIVLMYAVKRHGSSRHLPDELCEIIVGYGSVGWRVSNPGTWTDKAGKFKVKTKSFSYYPALWSRGLRLASERVVQYAVTIIQGQESQDKMGCMDDRYAVGLIMPEFFCDDDYPDRGLAGSGITVELAGGISYDQATSSDHVPLALKGTVDLLLEVSLVDRSVAIFVNGDFKGESKVCFATP